MSSGRFCLRGFASQGRRAAGRALADQGVVPALPSFGGGVVQGFRTRSAVLGIRGRVAVQGLRSRLAVLGIRGRVAVSEFRSRTITMERGR